MVNRPSPVGSLHCILLRHSARDIGDCAVVHVHAAVPSQPTAPRVIGMLNRCAKLQWDAPSANGIQNIDPSQQQMHCDCDRTSASSQLRCRQGDRAVRCRDVHTDIGVAARLHRHRPRVLRRQPCHRAVAAFPCLRIQRSRPIAVPTHPTRTTCTRTQSHGVRKPHTVRRAHMLGVHTPRPHPVCMPLHTCPTHTPCVHANAYATCMQVQCGEQPHDSALGAKDP